MGFLGYLVFLELDTRKIQKFQLEIGKIAEGDRDQMTETKIKPSENIHFTQEPLLEPNTNDSEKTNATPKELL